MSRTRHPVTRCAWCGRKISRGSSAKGRRGLRFCADGACGGVPQGKVALQRAIEILDKFSCGNPDCDARCGDAEAFIKEHTTLEQRFAMEGGRPWTL